MDVTTWPTADLLSFIASQDRTHDAELCGCRYYPAQGFNPPEEYCDPLCDLAEECKEELERRGDMEEDVA